MKRLTDIVVSIVALVLLSPLLVPIAIGAVGLLVLVARHHA